MYGLWIIISVLLAVIVGLTLRYKRVVNQKNRSLVRQIHERERLEKTIERILYKNYILNDKLKCKQ